MRNRSSDGELTLDWGLSLDEEQELRLGGEDEDLYVVVAIGPEGGVDRVFTRLEDAEEAYAGEFPPDVEYIELIGPGLEPRGRENPAFDVGAIEAGRLDDERAWRREQAMQLGMGLGVGAYNDFMGGE
jgi:hypothetical protein